MSHLQHSAKNHPAGRYLKNSANSFALRFCSFMVSEVSSVTDVMILFLHGDPAFMPGSYGESILCHFGLVVKRFSLNLRIFRLLHRDCCLRSFLISTSAMRHSLMLA